MAPDPTWFNLTNFIPDRLDVVADEIDVFSSTVLGLTIKCARCHTHKFDSHPAPRLFPAGRYFQRGL